METTGIEASPKAHGIWPAASQSFRDLFIWQQRTETTLPNGITKTEWTKPLPLKNPFSLLRQLTAKNWLYFTVGLVACTADAFDYQALAIQTVKFANYYDTSNTQITTAITLTHLLRSVGAAAFGLAGDKWGRKWPMVVNMFILGLLQVATIYSSTYSQFLAVRSLFGIFMGGVYGNAIAMALENCPIQSRGLMSGVLCQSGSLGYICAAGANYAVGGGVNSWKLVFWIATGMSCFVGFVRMCFPESKQFREASRVRRETEQDRHTNGHRVSIVSMTDTVHDNVTPGAFWKDTRNVLKREWRILVYCIILMSWLTYHAHASQDSYTTFLLAQKEFTNAEASLSSMIMKSGAVVGGITIGYLSQWFGRRRGMLLPAILSALLIPAWILPETEAGISIGGFAMQFCVGGAWGVVPIHLNELSPPAFRSVFPGVSKEIGNMISAPAAEIVNAIAESTSIKGPNGERVPAYGPVMGIFTAIIAIGVFVTVAFGPEKRGAEFVGCVAGLDPEKEAEMRARGDVASRRFGSDGTVSSGEMTEKESVDMGKWGSIDDRVKSVDFGRVKYAPERNHGADGMA